MRASSNWAQETEMSQNFTIDKKDTSLQLFKNEKKMFYLKVNWKKKAPSEIMLHICVGMLQFDAVFLDS